MKDTSFVEAGDVVQISPVLNIWYRNAEVYRVRKELNAL